MSGRNGLSRRRFLTGVAAGAAIGALPSRSAFAAEPVKALIIGSGYAGSVAALRLAQAGVDSVVLERGRRWPIAAQGGTFATPAAPDGRASWLNSWSPFVPQQLDVYPGVLEAFRTNSVIALAGAGVGGGSLVNNAVMLKPSQEAFNRAFGTHVDFDEMSERWYTRARALIGPAPMPDDVYASSYYTAARSFTAETTAAGLSPYRADMAVDWQAVREEAAGNREPSLIIARSIWGANSGAKHSVDRTILAAAEATGRVAVETLTRVVDVVPSGGRYLVGCERIDESGTVVARPEFSAEHVFFAAGSLGTSRLLVRARARGSLPALRASVGRGWGTNSDRQTVRVGMPWNNPTQGGPSGIVAQDLDNPYEPVTMINFPWPVPTPDGTGALAALAMTTCAAEGCFTYDAATDGVSLTWPATSASATRATQAVTATVDRINAANPGTSTLRVNADTASHTLGGVVLGKACALDGRLYGYDNLYVIDSSLIPGTMAAVPPALTVTALADRCVSKALTRILA
ncbi:GMC family oxidoreductase N-terminal domain-containing protein [Streptomyces sp. SM11]|uniref:GMC family oxidoreductase N-terminal domain-containing protein n=1 Tax=Streptomyces sp. SM11 TaxID=565557 RepID=UPI000CD5B1E9|nr:GMC family oxidoreductase N-terminal domain-containing protein [Streptomyces sp. SM11]